MEGAHELRVPVMHPIRVSLPEPGPVVDRTLRETGEPEKTVVEPHAARARPALELDLAEAGADLAHVHHPVTHREDRIHVVEIRVVHVPEMRGGERAGSREGFRLAVDEVGFLALETRPLDPVGIHDHGRKRDRRKIAGFVAHLRLDMHVGRAVFDVEVIGVNIGAGGLEIVEERQCLVDSPGEVQPHIVVDAAEVRVEGAAHPLKAHPSGLLDVAVGVVHLDGEDVVLVAEFDQVGKIEAAGGDAVLDSPGWLSVDEEAARLLQALEFEEDLPVFRAGGEFEVLPIPTDAGIKLRGALASAVADEGAVGVDIVPGVRRANWAPRGIVEIRLLSSGRILAEELPARIEVPGGARRGGRLEFPRLGRAGGERDEQEREPAQLPAEG